MNVDDWSDEQLKAVGWTDKQIAVARGVPLPPLPPPMPMPPPASIPPPKPTQVATQVAKTTTVHEFDWKDWRIQVGLSLFFLWLFAFAFGGANQAQATLAENQAVYDEFCASGGVLGDIGRETLGIADDCDEFKTKLFWIDFFIGPGAGWLWFLASIFFLSWGIKEIEK